MLLEWIVVAPSPTSLLIWQASQMRRCPTHGFGRNTRYQRRRPRTADRRHHGWYVLAPVRPVGHGRCANGGQPRRRSSDSGNPRSAFQGQLRHCLDRRLERPTRPRSTCRYATPSAGRGVCAETCALLLDANCNRVHGLDERHMGQRREPPHHSHRHCRHHRSREDPRDEGRTALRPAASSQLTPSRRAVLD